MPPFPFGAAEDREGERRHRIGSITTATERREDFPHEFILLHCEKRDDRKERARMGYDIGGGTPPRGETLDFGETGH